MADAEECLICDAAAEVRGICRRCYNQFQYKMQKMSLEERAEFDRKAIEAGLILAAGAAPRSNDNPFNAI